MHFLKLSFSERMCSIVYKFIVYSFNTLTSLTNLTHGTYQIERRPFSYIFVSFKMQSKMFVDIERNICNDMYVNQWQPRRRKSLSKILNCCLHSY